MKEIRNKICVSLYVLHLPFAFLSVWTIIIVTVDFTCVFIQFHVCDATMSWF